MAQLPDECPNIPPSESASAGLDSALERFEFQCPECKRPLAEFAEECPLCGANLMVAYSGIYRPPRNALAKLVAWLVLALFVGSMLVLFGIVVHRST